MLNKFINEPLIHFLVISIIIFFVYDSINKEEMATDKVIISEGRVAQLKNEILNSKNRLPVEEEMAIAIESFALNEIYLREARELGLHQGDKIIERRLRQKMEYLLDEMASIQQPDTAEIKNFYQANINRYKTDISYSFNQFYVSVDRSKEQLTKHLGAQKQRIAQGKSPIADSSMLPQQVTNQTNQQIKHKFGELFAAKLQSLAINTWSKPIDSGLGKHYVYITEKVAAMPKPLLSIKETLINDWQFEQRKRFKKIYEEELMRRYSIEIHQPKTDEA